MRAITSIFNTTNMAGTKQEMDLSLSTSPPPSNRVGDGRKIIRLKAQSAIFSGE